MMTPDQIDRIRSSFKMVSGRGDELADQFFTRLFANQPLLKALLPRDRWMRSRDFLTGLGLLVKNMHRLDSIEHVLMDFGVRSTRAGATPQHFGLAREALLQSLGDLMGADWTDALENDWSEALNTVSSLVILGAGRSRAKAA